MGKYSRLLPSIAAAVLLVLLWNVHSPESQSDLLNKPQFSPVKPYRWFRSSPGSADSSQDAFIVAPSLNTIGDLIADAEKTTHSLLSTETTTLEDAAKSYRTRRGRHPPAGFHLWHEYARSHNAIIVEEFWDQIYEDLNAFWAIAPSQLRAHTRKMGMTVVIESGKARATTDWFWHTVWAKMIGQVSQYLPDTVLALNPMDEPRLMVPFSEMSRMMGIADVQKPDYLSADYIHSNITGWGLEEESLETQLPEIRFRTTPPYSYARKACSPDSPVRQQNAAPNLLATQIDLQHDRTISGETAHYQQAFIANTTKASNLCNDPSIAYYHAALTDPLSASTSTDLLPMFGGSKFANVNNDILLPAPMYWNEEERFIESDEIPWSSKSDSVIWRGTATGGWNKPNTWTRFHRHRFVGLTNGTKYEVNNREPSDMFTSLWNLTAISALVPSIRDNLPRWLNTIMDVGFTDLFCDTHDDTHDPAENPWGECWYTSPHYKVVPGRKLSEQYNSKYLPDVDGNSFSGRYRSFLLSNSLPIKATLYREWHDSRLIAWKHFVPMNNRFDDFFRIMQYFVGCKEEVCGAGGAVNGHDDQAEKIAREGREWAEKVLRKEDMQIYVFRLLLEWARVTDDDRLSIGWVDDLKGT